MSKQDAAPTLVLAEKRSPDKWAEELFPKSERGRIHPDLWKHGAAQALHGWVLHAHHAGEPIQLTRSDYEKALSAACQLVGTTYVPHAAALSPHFGGKG